MATSTISLDILKGRRQYFAHEVKQSLVNALISSTSRGKGILEKIHLLWDVWNIVKTVSKYPEPTRENTKKQITHVLLDLWDEFETYNVARKPLFKALRRLSVCEAEHDIDYSQRMTWFLMRLTAKYLSGEWIPLEPWAPKGYWSDPVVIEKWRKARQELTIYGTIGGRALSEIET